MDGDYFENRKEQIEKEFMRKLSTDLKSQGVTLSGKARQRIKRELRDAAMVGASEERHRTLQLLRYHKVDGVVETAVTSQLVLSVLGYE